MEEYRTDYGIAVGNGLRGTIRGLQTMAGFMRGREDAAIQRAGVGADNRAAGRPAGGERRGVDAPVRLGRWACWRRPGSARRPSRWCGPTRMHRPRRSTVPTSSSWPTWRTGPSTARC